jgi:hypothetical protein
VKAGKFRAISTVHFLYVDVSAYAEKSAKLVLIFIKTALVDAGKLIVLPLLCILYVDVSAYLKKICEISFNLWLLANRVYFLPSVSAPT